MEKLQEAIARARAQRHGEIGKLPPYDQTGQTATPAKETEQSERLIYTPGRPAKRRAPPPADIHYSQTRVVELDPEVLERNRVIAGRHDDRRVEAYRHLRTRVLQTLQAKNWTTLAITSPQERAGKTLTAVNLAISLSHEVNHTVLLVDLDLRKPNIHTTLGVEIDRGLVDVVDGNARVEEVLFNPCMPRLVVLPGKPLGRQSSEILTSPAMANLLREITARYESRLVIFDLPPLLRNDDALKFTPFAEATLMVVEDGANTPEDVERSLHLLQNANLIGTILNKAR